MARMWRLTLATALSAVVIVGVAWVAVAQTVELAPYDEEAGPAELDFWAETFACPEFPGLERLVDRDSVTVDDSITNSRSCTYRSPDSGQTHTLEMLWDKADDPFDSFCVDREDTRDAGTTVTARFTTEGRTHSMEGTYRLGTDAVALESQFEAAARAWMTAAAPFVRVCPDPPIAISCPQLHDRDLPTGEPEELRPDHYILNCFYGSSDTRPSSVRVTLWWVAPNALSDLMSRTCGEPEFSRNGVGMVRSADQATIASYFIASPLEEDDEAGVVAVARQLVAAAEAQAISCEGVDVSGVADPYSEIPAYLAPAFADEFIAPPPGTVFGGGPGDGGGAPDIFGSDPAGSTSGGPGAGTLSKVLTIGMLGLSLLGLAVTFLLVRRETRVRPGRDIFRVAVTGVVATLMVVVFSRGAPLWAVAIGIGAGLALGAWQGSNLMVRLTERGFFAKRSTLAVVAFAAGIALSQIAGLLNRTGTLSIGIGLSFLSASLTFGLILGRSPRLAEARGSGVVAGLLLVVALVVVGFATAAPGSAQEASQAVERPAGTCNYFLGAPSGPGSDESRCDGHRLMIDLVDWDRVGIAGGLFWTGAKPFTEIAVPRALDEPPQPLTQTIEWTTEVGWVLEVTETFEFSLRADGKCCSVDYEGSGSRTVTQGNGEVVVTTREASGRLHDIQPVGVSLNGPFARGPASVLPGTPFSEVTLFNGQPEDACIRLVAEPVSSNRQEGAWSTYLLDGEARESDSDLTMAMVIGCDVPGFTYEAALAAAPPPPPGDDPSRGGCPVRQEVIGELMAVSGLDGVATQTVASLFLTPNEPACVGGGDYGEGGRGGTRHELSAAFQADDPIAWARTVVSFEENWFFAFRPDRIPADERCDVDADGIPVRPAGDEGCEVISMHLIPLPSSISGIRQSGSTGMVWMRTDYFADGPNVNIRALLRGVEYRYRCHHCLPGDPRITDFLKGLHGFSSRTRIEITGPPAPVVARPTPAVAAAPPPDAAAAPDEDDLSEDAATVALIGLLGSSALLAAALIETGFNSPAELLAALRRGDLTGPPPLLDEDDEPLFVNDGSYPEAPVGHVWWGIDEDEGRWVSPEEAQDLVSQARAADTALEKDRSDALDRMMDQADEDWKTLIKTTRAQTAAENLERAIAGEERAVLRDSTLDAWAAAVEAGDQDLVDFIDGQETLTSDQIYTIFEALNRRADDEAALAAIPEVNVLREGVEGTLEDLAAVADAAGQPAVGWILRNPGTSLRVGAAIASGGVSEYVAVPLDIARQLHEAQERSLRENGRMMSSGELFGELGTAVAWEAVYEVGGRLAGHGIGRVFSSADEVAEAAIRQGDETLPTIRSSVEEGLETGGRESLETGAYTDVLAREGAEGLETGAKEGMETGATRHVESGARGGADPLAREGMEAELEAAAREGAEVAETGAKEGMETGAHEGTEAFEAGAHEGVEEATEAGARQLDEAGEDLLPVPPKGNEALRDLPEGGPVTDDLIEETGLTRQHLDEMQDYTSKNELNASGRSSNPYSAKPLADGTAVKKPLEIKVKTGGDLDVLLGAKPHNRGVVTLFEPKMPNTAGMSPELIEALEKRHASRMTEWTKHGDAWSKGNRVLEFGGVERTHRFIDGRIEVLYDGKWRSVGGDFDLVDLTNLDGSPLTPAEFNRHVEAMVEKGLIEHGGEVRVMTDILRDLPNDLNSDEFIEKAAEVWRLREGLENAHPDEIVLEIRGGADGGVFRGATIDELAWKGGFEAPDGTLR